jgi:hypothetical protein
MQDLKAAQAERLQGELAGQQRSEICQLQERYQQVRHVQLGGATRCSLP